MNSYRVWAPHASQVELVFEPAGTVVQLVPAERGFFSVHDSRIRSGQAYRLLLDGEGPFPDPRSSWQPEGVQGPSCFVEFGEFPWTDGDFRAVGLEAGVLYEVHIGTFTPLGTFDSAIGRLDDLKELGITHLEIMPIAQFPGERGWGYDGVALFAPQNSYGGPLGFARLVDACHQRGIAVILDVVYNHLGPSGNHLSKYGPYFTHRYHTPWGDALNFDGPGSDEVRRFICDNAKHWLMNYHVDGLRLDATHALFDQSATHILAQLSQEVALLAQELGRPLVLIAEHCLNDARAVRPVEHGGHGMTSQWSDDVHNAVHALLTGEGAGYYQDYGKIVDLAQALRHGFLYRGQYCPSRDRAFGGAVSGLSGEHFVAYLQNHDQVGNRARGERLSQLCSFPELKTAAALLLLAPFVPLLFMGEEWASERPFHFFVDHPEAELKVAVREGRLREFEAFGWNPGNVPDPSSEHAFVSSQLDWEKRGAGKGQEMLKWYTALLQLRRTHPELQGGQLDTVQLEFDEQGRWLVMQRGKIQVCAYFGQGVHPWEQLRGRLLLSSTVTEQGSETSGPAVIVIERGV